MKTLAKVFVYMVYVVTSPLILIFSMAILAWACVKCKREFGEFDVKGNIKEYVSGMKEGHQINMSNINSIEN